MSPKPSTKVLPAQAEAVEAFFRYPLLDAVFNRRSRRFGLGMAIPDGPTRFKSEREPLPLDPLEEALLIAAGTGISGHSLADVPFWVHGTNMGGDTWLQFTGRTFPSACASHGTELFYTNDQGSYLVKLRDVPAARVQEYQGADDRERLLAVCQAHTHKLSDGRLDLPRTAEAISTLNLWDANWPGSTLFMPVADNSWEIINVLLTMYAFFQKRPPDPAKSRQWAEKGYLYRGLSIPAFEQWVRSSIIAEGAFIGQNMMLAIQAMGLGGWLYGGFTPLVVMGGTPLTPGLGFRFVQPTGDRLGAYCSGEEQLPLNPVGVDGLFEAHCPPYFPDMAAAVDAVVAAKWGPRGIYDGADVARPYKDPRATERDVPRPRDEVIESVKAVCRVIYERCGKFPATVPTMEMIYWIQAQHCELEFYDTHYPPGAYTATQRDHMRLWHGAAEL